MLWLQAKQLLTTDLTRKIVIYLWQKNSWKCCGHKLTLIWRENFDRNGNFLKIGILIEIGILQPKIINIAQLAESNAKMRLLERFSNEWNILTRIWFQHVMQ